MSLVPESIPPLSDTDTLDHSMIGSQEGNAALLEHLAAWTPETCRSFYRENDIHPMVRFIFRDDSSSCQHLPLEQRPRLRVMVKEVEDIILLFDIEAAPQGCGMGTGLLEALRDYAHASGKMLLVNRPTMTSTSQYQAWYAKFPWLTHQSASVEGHRWTGLVYNANDATPEANLRKLGLIP